MGTYYLSTPIYYVNDLPHIGHIYTTLVADTLARYRRMAGDDVFFLTGTDEHGQNIERAAARQGIRPIELADRVVSRYHDLWRRFDITHQDFVRTTEPRHRRGVEEMVRRIGGRGRSLRRAPRGLVLQLVRDLLHREGARPARQSLPDPRPRHGMEVGGERLLPALEVRAAAAGVDRLGGAGDPAREPAQRGARLRPSRGCATSRCRAPRSSGASRSPAGRARRSTSGSTRSRTTSARSASALRRARAGTCTSATGARRCPPAPDRQGHHPPPLCLLAGVPDVGGRAAAHHDLGARLVAARPEEDVQVGRQRGASGPPGRALRAGRPALLPVARNGLRPGRELLDEAFVERLQQATSPTTSATPRAGWSRSRARPSAAARRPCRATTIRSSRSPPRWSPSTGRRWTASPSRAPCALSGGCSRRRTSTWSRASRWKTIRSEGASDALSRVLWNGLESVRIVATGLLPFMPTLAPRVLAGSAWRRRGARSPRSPGAGCRPAASSRRSSRSFPVSTRRSTCPRSRRPRPRRPGAGGRAPAGAVPQPGAAAAAAAPANVANVIDIQQFGAVELKVGQVLLCEAVPKSRSCCG